jgi:hypothetical protein
MDNSPELNEVLTRIKNTTQILQAVKSTDLKIEREIFLTPLFENTPLDRSTGIDAVHETEDVILRKNIFFIAKKTTNPNELILTLMHKGLLTSEEIDTILPQNDNLIKFISVLACVITKEPDQLPAFIEALKQCNNHWLAECLENSLRKSILEADQEAKATWECQNCTFINTSPLVCDMCFKSKDYKTATAANSSTLVCPQCTYFNPPGHSHCEMCNNVIGVEDVDTLDEVSCQSAETGGTATVRPACRRYQDTDDEEWFDD